MEPGGLNKKLMVGMHVLCDTGRGATGVSEVLAVRGAQRHEWTETTSATAGLAGLGLTGVGCKLV